MLKPLRTPALLCAMMLTACSTTQPTPALPSPNSPIKAVPCTELPVLAYHAPDTAEGIREWLAGALPDPQNAYDTPSTVAAVRRANAARSAVCGP